MVRMRLSYLQSVSKRIAANQGDDASSHMLRCHFYNPEGITLYHSGKSYIIAATK